MALGSLPPWLQISPKDYLLATQAGVQAGHAIANSAQLAFEKQQQLQMEQEKAKAQLAQQAIENAAQRLAAERLEQYRRDEVANRQQQLGIEQQRLRGLDIQQQRADDLARHQMAMEQQKLQADKTRDYGAPAFMDVPGIPGAKISYRPGSPGMHAFNAPRQQGQLSQGQALNALKTVASLQETDPSVTNAIPYLKSIAFPGGVAAPYAPRDPKERQANTVYRTPKGAFLWTGKSWDNVPTQTPLSQPTTTDQSDGDSE